MTRVLDLLQMSWREITAHAGRSLLSALTLILGVCSIVAVQVTSVSIESVLVRDQELQLGRDGSVTAHLAADPVTYANVDSLVEQFPNSGVALFDGGEVRGSLPSGTPVRIRGYDGNLLSGYPFAVKDSDPRPRQILSNSSASWASQRGEAVKITGPDGLERVVRPSGSVDDGDSEATLYVPVRQLGQGHGAEIIFLAQLSGSRDAKLSRVEHAAARSNVSIDDVDVVDAAAAITGTLATIRTGFIAVGVVTLTVGVLGIINIGLATTRMRSEELALRRSLGATKSDLRWLVLLEAALVGGIGALIAIATTWVGYRVLINALAGGYAPPFPDTAIVIGLVAGIGAGALGGLVPAVKAARAPIAAVMRA